MENENQTDLEEVINEVEQEQQEEVVEETPELDLSKFDSADNPDVIKVDLSKPPIVNETEETNSDDTGAVSYTHLTLPTTPYV